MVRAAGNRIKTRLEPVHAVDELLSGETDMSEIAQRIDVITRPQIILHRCSIARQFAPQHLCWIAGSTNLSITFGHIFVLATAAPIDEQRAVICRDAVAASDVNLHGD